MDPVSKCLNTVVFIFNFSVFVISTAIVALGAYIYTTLVIRYDGMIDDLYQDAAIILMFIGSVMMLVSFFGCCGACVQSACMIYFYATFLLLILLGLFGLAAATFIYEAYLWDALKGRLDVSIIPYGYPQGQSNTDLWNIIQKDGKCCGVVSYKDWLQTGFGANTGDVPDECCIETVKGCGKGMAWSRSHNIENIIHTDGCLPVITKFVKKLATIGAAISMGVAAFLCGAIYVSIHVAGKIVGDEPLPIHI